MIKVSDKSVYLEEYIEINGIKQYLFHSSKNVDNPVMLFLHGGPGSVESIYAYIVQDKWEENYTVVHWDQRGSGKTLIKNPSKKNYPIMEQLMLDLLEIVKYLKKVYNKKKIVIMGYSWGSVLGTDFVKKYPEEVEYYIGVGQVVDMFENEKLAYEKVKEEIKKSKHRRYLKVIKSFGEYPEKSYTKSMRAKLVKLNLMQQKYKLAVVINFSMIKNFLRSPIFKFSDIRAMIKGLKANEKLMEYLIKFNLNKQSYEYKVPVYYILGENDWQVPTILAKRYFNKIIAPHKKIYIIKNSGHRPMLEEKKLFEDALLDIFNINNNNS